MDRLLFAVVGVGSSIFAVAGMAYAAKAEWMAAGECVAMMVVGVAMMHRIARGVRS